MKESDFEKILFVLKELYRNDKSKNHFSEVLNFAQFRFTPHRNLHAYPNSFELNIYLEYEVFLKNYNLIDILENMIMNDIIKSSNIAIYKIKITPNYDKISVFNSKIRVIETPWEKINEGQLKLVELLVKSNDKIDFRNIGNSARVVLQTLGNTVYDEKKHHPSDTTIDVSPEKFKNQLHSYLKSELAGDSNKELRDFAISAISTVEDAIDLANKLTHKMDAEKEFAEVCVIGTITAISIVKLVEENSLKLKN